MDRGGRVFAGLGVCGLVLGFLAGCSSTSPATPARELVHTQAQPEVLVGEWRSVPIDAEIKALADYAAATLGDQQQDPLSRVLRVKSQQVAGTNYALVLEFASGQRWQVGLYRDQDGMLQITNSSRL